MHITMETDMHWLHNRCYMGEHKSVQSATSETYGEEQSF